MRFFVALFAVLALIAAPALARPVCACADAGAQAAFASASAKTPPCCDHDKPGQGHKAGGCGCAALCTAAVLPSPQRAGARLAFRRAHPRPPGGIAVVIYAPGRLDPPPKSIL